MSITPELQQIWLLVCALVIAVSAVVAATLFAQLRNDIRRALRPTSQERALRLLAQATANKVLLETPAGRNSLVEFFVSEANISAFFRETEERVQEATSDEELRRLLSQLKDNAETKPWYSLDRLKKGAKAIGEKLFDKANDLVKPYLGGGSANGDA